MSKYYVSFGQCHAHRIQGITFDCDSILEFEADSMSEARDRVFASTIGDKFFTVYSEGNLNLSYFPRGVIKGQI